MNQIDQRYMDLLFEEAKNLEPVGGKRSRVMAAIVFKKTLVIFGNNLEKTDPMQKLHSGSEHKAFIHAEMMAIKRALNHFRGDSSRLKDATLYVMRAKKEKGNGSKPSKSWIWGNSCPCKGCARAIKDYEIKRIVYSLDVDNTCGEATSDDF